MAKSAQSFSILAVLAVLTACSGNGGEGAPGDTSDTQPFSEIAEDDVLRLTGTEPFWGATIEGETMIYSTPENIEGTMITLSRFAGRGGLSFSGEMDGRAVDIAVTPGDCSDGMSDREYPLTVTLQIGNDQLYGCGRVLDEDELTASDA